VPIFHYVRGHVEDMESRAHQTLRSVVSDARPASDVCWQCILLVERWHIQRSGVSAFDTHGVF